MVAALFVRADSVYKSMPGVDAWDAERDARKWPGGCQVVAHPPCRAWGRLRKFAKPRDDEKSLAFFAIDAVRSFGGVLEHPAQSSLWPAAGLPEPKPRCFDRFGGFSICVDQFWWGHRARKRTYLYVCGIQPGEVPTMPLDIGTPPAVIGGSDRHKRAGYVHLPKSEREHSPAAFARWLVDLAARCKVAG